MRERARARGGSGHVDVASTGRPATPRSVPRAYPEAMTAALRPVEVDDLDALALLDAAYAATHGLALAVVRASLAFYARSGHAFVAGPPGAPLGFVFAHAVWDGARPTVTVARVVAVDDDAGVLHALVEAVVKSAYDAAVYDLVIDLPAGDAAARAALDAPWIEQPVRRFERVLGARAASASSPPDEA